MAFIHQVQISTCICKKKSIVKKPLKIISQMKHLDDVENNLVIMTSVYQHGTFIAWRIQKAYKRCEYQGMEIESQRESGMG